MSETAVDFDDDEAPVYEEIEWDDETIREKEAREARIRRLQTRRSIEDWLETKDLRGEWGDDFIEEIG